MKHFFWVFVAIYSSLVLVACNKNNGGDAGIIGGTCVTQTPYGQCFDANGILVSGMAGQIPLAYFADNWSYQKSVTILDQTTYREFLRTAMGVCDRYANTGGTASCSSWVNGGFDLVMTPTSVDSMNVTVRTWPQYNGYSTYYYNLPTWKEFALGFLGVPVAPQAGVQANPMVLTTYSAGNVYAPTTKTVFPINNNAGFEVRYDSPYGSFSNARNMIQIRVDQGKVGDPSFSFTMYYPNCISTGGASSTCTGGVGTAFARGTLTRCQTPNCTGGLW